MFFSAYFGVTEASSMHTDANEWVAWFSIKSSETESVRPSPLRQAVAPLELTAWTRLSLELI